MIHRFAALILICLSLGLAVSQSAAAQFGPERPSPRTPEEFYADRTAERAGGLNTGDTVDRAAAMYLDARTKYKPLCENREVRADFWSRNCYKLANLHRQGRGAPQDFITAKRLYNQACLTGGHAPSCLQQAYLSHTGTGTPQDWPYARTLYSKACTLGDQSGCAGLGNMLYRGQGGATDRKRGRSLLQDACFYDNTWACDRLTGFGIVERRR